MDLEKSISSINDFFIIKKIFLYKNLNKGGIILLASLYLFDAVFSNIVLITFSTLILTEFLNVYSEVI